MNKLLALLIFPITAYSAEAYMLTEVGKVVLTDSPCQIQWEQPGNGLDWAAYATEQGQPDHIGCWKEVDKLTVQAYWPEINASSLHKKTLFKFDK